eukprot:scaffold227_cov165-Amphora_coffeaeformis.AAC.11
MSKSIRATTEDDDDGALWEPLEAVGQTAATQTSRPREASAAFSLKNPQSNTSQQESRYPQQREPKASSTNETMSLETKPGQPPQGSAPPRKDSSPPSHHDLQTYLVDHPMQLFWTRFALHFARELWQLDLHLRFAMILITSGYIINGVLSSYYYSSYFWSPRWILLAVLLVGPWVYFVERTTFPQQLQAGLETVLSPEHLVRALAAVEPSTMRTICLGLLFVPTLFEAKNLVFLSHIKAEAGWSLYNAAIALSIFALQYILWTNLRLSPKECSQKAVIFLYGSALLVSLGRTDLRRLPWLAGPFSVSTGVLLWTGHEQDVLARVLRQALRRTVQDVVQHVGTTVHQNEVLQLALLRWLTDYWTTSDDNKEMSDRTSSDTPARTSCDTSAPHATSTPSAQQTAHHPPQQDLNWQDVFPMLTVTVDHSTPFSRIFGDAIPDCFWTTLLLDSPADPFGASLV